MLHLKPIAEKDASLEVLTQYKTIKTLLKTDSVPLYFQYIANYEVFLTYIWERLSPNIATESFADMHDELMTFSQMTIDIIYTPSKTMASYIDSVSESQIAGLREQAVTIKRMSSLLFYLALAVRESIKGVTVPTANLPALQAPDTYFSDLSLSKHHHPQAGQDNEGLDAVLVPLFGETHPSIHYADFFSHIALEMEALTKSEAYLKTRVELEHIGMLYLNAFPYPLGTSYRQVVNLIGKEPYVYELIHLLKDIFPTTFPRLLLTSSVMLKTLTPQTQLATT